MNTEDGAASLSQRLSYKLTQSVYAETVWHPDMAYRLMLGFVVAHGST